MPGGIYIALSGLSRQADQLDQLASDIANTSTSGYKTERTSSVASERPTFSRALQAAIDVAPGDTEIDFAPGSVVATGRALDFALSGPGFFVIETPEGLQFTRNGHFAIQPDGSLTTADGMAVQGEIDDEEFGPLVLAEGEIGADADGTVLVDGQASGRLRVVDFADYDVLTRTGAGRFSVRGDVEPELAESFTMRGGALEQSNVSMADRLVHVTKVARTFEALQRGMSVLMNDVDGRAISELGRR